MLICCFFQTTLLNTCPAGLELGQGWPFLGAADQVGGQVQWDDPRQRGQRAGVRPLRTCTCRPEGQRLLERYHLRGDGGMEKAVW